MMPKPARRARASLHRVAARALFAVALTLAGTTDAVAAGLICTSRDTLIFGNRALGSSTTATSTVTNCGDAPWSFRDISVHPATGPAFHVASTCASGETLAPGAACTVSVTFAPTVPGQTSGGFWLYNTTVNAAQLVTFYGRGVDADAGSATLNFAPSTATFAPQAVGVQSAPLTVLLQNAGSAPLTPSAIILNGPAAYDFVGVSDTCQVGTPIAAGGSCSLALYFQPAAAGDRRANLVIDAPQLAALAVLQVSGAGVAPVASTTNVIEFHHTALDHYFISAAPEDIDALDSGRFPGWARTGLSFKAYAQATPGTSAVCRYYLPPPLDSHFYSASPDECAAVAAKWPQFVLEAPDVFFIALPDRASGACPAATVPVYRLFDARVDANHRYTTDAAVKAQMIARGYVAEGYGPDATIMCAPR